MKNFDTAARRGTAAVVNPVDVEFKIDGEVLLDSRGNEDKFERAVLSDSTVFELHSNHAVVGSGRVEAIQ